MEHNIKAHEFVKKKSILGSMFKENVIDIQRIVFTFNHEIFVICIVKSARKTAHYGEYKWAVYRMLKVLSFARNILQMLCFLSTVSVFPWAKMTLCHLLWRSLWRRFALKTLTYCSLLCTIILKLNNYFSRKMRKIYTVSLNQCRNKFTSITELSVNSINDISLNYCSPFPTSFWNNLLICNTNVKNIYNKD